MSSQADIQKARLELGARYRKYTAEVRTKGGDTHITIYFNTNPDDIEQSMIVPVANVHFRLNVDAPTATQIPANLLKIIRGEYHGSVLDNRNRPAEARYIGFDLPTEVNPDDERSTVFLHVPQFDLDKSPRATDPERKYFAIVDIFKGSIPGYDPKTALALVSQLQSDPYDPLDKLDQFVFERFRGLSGKLSWIARRVPEVLSTRAELIGMRSRFAPKLGGHFSNQVPSGTIATLNRDTKPDTLAT